MIVSVVLIGGDDPEVYHMTNGKLKQHNNIELKDVFELAEFDPIWVHRGKAIQAYAILEGSLLGLLVALTGMAYEDASVVFYKIINTGSRRAIFEKLIQRKHGTRFSPFWNAAILQLRQIDDKRNEIAHWIGVANVKVNVDQVLLMGVTLVPPTSIPIKAASPRITSRDLIEFRDKCLEFSSLVSTFATRINPPKDVPELGEPWFDIFQLPFVYPLPEGHPSKLRTATRQNHPRSFPESLQFLRVGPDGRNLQVWLPE
jgi:hypothetical protein